MAFGIMEKLFGNISSQPTQQTTQQSQPNNAPAASPGTPGNLPANTVPSSPTNVNAPAGTTEVPGGGEPSPLAQFSDLWQPAANNPANSPSIFANVDPKKLMEAASKTDFSRVITPEVRQAISQGGEQGSAAFMQAMNQMSQTVFAQSAMATSKIVEQALEAQQKKFQDMLPGIIKQHTVSDNLRSENPIFNDPAVRPLISAMEHQFAQKHPNATASELTAMAKQYVSGLGQVFNPTQVNTGGNSNNSQITGDTDWSKFIEG